MEGTDRKESSLILITHIGNLVRCNAEMCVESRKDALLELTLAKIEREDGWEWWYASGGTTSSMDEGGRDLCCQAVK